MSFTENTIKDLMRNHMRRHGVDEQEPTITMLAPPSLTLYQVEGYKTGEQGPIYVLAPGYTRAVIIAAHHDRTLDPRDAFAAEIAEVSYEGIKPGVVHAD